MNFFSSAQASAGHGEKAAAPMGVDLSHRSPHDIPGLGYNPIVRPAKYGVDPLSLTMKTAPPDVRFFAVQNQSMHCWTLYNEFLYCANKEHDSRAPKCLEKWHYVRSFCPNDLVNAWQTDRAEDKSFAYKTNIEFDDMAPTEEEQEKYVAKASADADAWAEKQYAKQDAEIGRVLDEAKARNAGKALERDTPASGQFLKYLGLGLNERKHQIVASAEEPDFVANVRKLREGL